MGIDNNIHIALYQFISLSDFVLFFFYVYRSHYASMCIIENQESIQQFDDYRNVYMYCDVGRFQAAVTSFRGKIWVVGGCDAWNPLRSVEIYDPANNSWSQGPPISTPRRGCGLAVRKGKKRDKVSNLDIYLLKMEMSNWH